MRFFTTTALAAVAMSAGQALADGCTRGLGHVAQDNQGVTVTVRCTGNHNTGWDCGPYGARISPVPGRPNTFSFDAGRYQVTARLLCLDGLQTSVVLFCPAGQRGEMIVDCASGNYDAYYYRDTK
ncbi:hypothetical protein E4U53_007509 [Claviceps sorghi]|nr:hypothetical protein E4U53_007509 [Claviceps sorghi]